MTSSHQSFEVLCTLAITGELDEREFAALSDHVRLCDACRRRFLEMAFVGSQLSLAREVESRRVRAPKGMRERFIRRAALEGVPLRQQRRAYRSHLALGALALAILVLAALAMHWKAPAPAPMESSAMPEAGQETPAPIHSTESTLPPADKSRLVVFHAAASSAARSKSTGAKSKTQSSSSGSIPSLPAFVEAREPNSGNQQLLFASLSSRPRELAPWDEKPAMPAAFLLSDNRSNCESLVRAQPWDLNPGVPPGRHIFCYNSGIASLTSIDLFHTAASNAARGVHVERLEFHLSQPSTQ
jgi:hypothetical protein